MEDFKYDEAITICQKQMDKKGAIPLAYHMRKLGWRNIINIIGSLFYLKKGLTDKALEDTELGMKAKGGSDQERIDV